MSTACSYCQVTLVGLENGKRFKTIMDSTPIFYALDVRFLPMPAALSNLPTRSTIRDLSNRDGWYALFAYQLCTSHNQKVLQSVTLDRCAGDEVAVNTGEFSWRQ